jgi:Zn-dependent protease with chaperone function
LGFGNQLLAAMRDWEASSPRESRANLLERVFASHPPMRLRINKLASYMRQRGGER